MPRYMRQDYVVGIRQIGLVVQRLSGFHATVAAHSLLRKLGLAYALMGLLLACFYYSQNDLDVFVAIIGLISVVS
jgi:hypothetical protein